MLHVFPARIKLKRVNLSVSYVLLVVRQVPQVHRCVLPVLLALCLFPSALPRVQIVPLVAFSPWQPLVYVKIVLQAPTLQAQHKLHAQLVKLENMEMLLDSPHVYHVMQDLCNHKNNRQHVICVLLVASWVLLVNQYVRHVSLVPTPL